jgi:16S rRNA (guanine(966)-N(2))-methyltransferase RsmD
LGVRRAAKEARPTSGKVLSALFSILDAAGRIKGARFLDLFAGSGGVSIAAMRRGASSVLAVECERVRAERISAMLLDQYGASARCVCADARRAIPKLASEGAVFGVIFADPPYGMGWSEQLPRMIASRSMLLSPGGIFVLERSIHDPVAEPPGFSDFFTARDDRIYGDTVLSFYGKNSSGSEDF